MKQRTPEKIGLVFIHGAGLEGRIWSKVATGLDHPVLLAELPQRKGDDETRKGLSLADYVNGIKRQVDEWGIRKFMIVAHSLGGVLALGLASELKGRVAGIAAIGAVIPENGGSFVSAMPFPKRIVLPAILRKMGTKPPAAAIRAGLCNDLPADQAAEIVRGFIPEAVRVYTDRIGVSVPNVPKLYVKLTKDKELAPSLQNKMISNFSPQSVRSLETGHLPMLSDPDGLRSILEDFLADAGYND
ncbi:alpha/beta hydrolase [Gordoniibacillus kamchatkensis]|uniref:Alpha/beta hydrolase n=1 Tax=Gordoniibacillus kamchatkensis TaxID=1590651 RepID=A0ABR5AG04_9BACL|nr:alpha/beta hydrolase [Paenibacillus sp. VKM B-2647]KIL39969.1 alpha/beta hydrolase [Paenibacillus sp. VKM B-2647]